MVELGAFRVEFMHVNHSIAGACALAITTPVGTIVHTGDFKIDFTPHGRRAASIWGASRSSAITACWRCWRIRRTWSARAMTMSERKVGETFIQAVRTRRRDASSSRCSPATCTAFSRWWMRRCAYGRKVCLVGRSMVNVSRRSPSQLGYLNIPEGSLITVDELDRYPDDEDRGGHHGQPGRADVRPFAHGLRRAP